MDTVSRLSPVTIVLHWTIAISVIGLMGLGWYMTEFEQWNLYHSHKSLGLLLICVILLRVAWRIKNGWPAPVSKYSNIEVFLAKSTHWVIIISSVLMPLWGMLFSAASGHGFGIFGWALFPANHSPINQSEVVPLSEYWSAFGQKAHETNGKILMVFIALHVLGALKHHFFDRDATLLRMLGRK